MLFLLRLKEAPMNNSEFKTPTGHAFSKIRFTTLDEMIALRFIALIIVGITGIIRY